MKRVCDNCKGLINNDKDAIRVNGITWAEMGGETYSFLLSESSKEMAVCQDCYDRRIRVWR